jgi:sterol desaturase/sphingolipid hydroxylase (fatty acid hydroxylase superfamily)
VTTTIRQHPLEGILRIAALVLVAVPLGASLEAFAVYRLASVVTALFEHANIRLPDRLDTALAWLTASPNLHKVHHSRNVLETDRNYGNLFSLWDRIFGTFVPARRGLEVAFGLEGFDEPSLQTTAALFALPFVERDDPQPRGDVAP